MKIVFLLLLISTSVLADYKSELKAIEKFEKDEFVNDKNYPPTKPGQIKKLTKEFYEKLQKDPISLKYFVFLAHAYRMIDKYKADKAFALAMESKFGGKKMTTANWDKVWEVLSNKLFKDSNADHKKSLADPTTANAYFEKSMALINASSFK